VAAGGAVAARRGRSTAPWQCAAWIMLAAGALIAWSVATA